MARRGRSLQTAKVYRKAFVSFWRWAATEGIPADPGAVDHHVLNRYADALLATPATRNGEPILEPDPHTGEPRPKMLEPSTRRVLWANLRPFFTWWCREAERDNPFVKADSPGGERPAPPPVVSLDDLRKVLATCAMNRRASPGEATWFEWFYDVRDAAIVRTFADIGARLGEMESMTVDSWDRQSGMLTLVGKTGTRVVPPSLSTAEALSRYVKARREHPDAGLGALWLGRKGALHASGFAQLLKRRCALAGVAHINPHRIRHTWAHEFRVAGGSEGDLMYLAGWSTPAMAHRYGASAAASRAQDAARQLSIGDQL